MTSTTRTLFAFSRNGADPDARFWTRATRMKHTYTGQRSTVDLPSRVTSADELEMEYDEHHPGHHHRHHSSDAGDA